MSVRDNPTDPSSALMQREQFLLESGKTPDAQTLAASRARRARREQWQPDVSTVSEALPIDARRDEIIAALQTHQVVVVSGETGSGKTTQLPRYALAAGFGRRAMIGHTQPRRLAARSVAARIAEQTGTTLGDGVGYAVRFDDQSAAQTLVRLMTDGILLNELARDRLLLAYEVIIIDEAHERSLNIDFLLGILATLLPRRPDLKLIITSATIDHQRFARHFNDAPVIEVSGRGYPVEVVYSDEPSAGDDSRLLSRRIVEAAKMLMQRALPRNAADLLVFLPGEREIRDAERALNKSGLLKPGGFEVLPLYGRLSDQQQNTVFQPGKARRIVLATNVAETSLTVPRIGAVIDSGLARISRYSPRSRVQRLQLEPISQASANQRAGRCGRLGPGVCLRLYTEAEFDAREAFTDAEILRTNLASVVLQMAALNLGEIDAFPFLDQPDVGQIDDAYRLLHELEAIDQRGAITRAGRAIARLPLDPRLARMLLQLDDPLEAGWMIVVVAGLSVQDPRQRPLEQARAADDIHRQYHDPQSDFMSLVRLWQRIERERKVHGRSAFERWCAGQFLSARRIREWREVATQLARQLKADIRVLPLESPPDESLAEKLHRRILSGLLSHAGVIAEGSEYDGCFRRRFRLHPGSALAGRQPKWVAALEIVQTQQRYARYAMAIDNQWLAPMAAHVVEYEYDAPYWQARRGRVEARRTTLLFGLVIRANERIDYSRVDRVASRATFIRDGLVADRVRLNAPFIEHNRRQSEALAALAGQWRRPVEISDAQKAALYDDALPQQVCDARSLKRWLQKDPARRNAALSFAREALMAEQSDAAATMPDSHQIGGNRLRIDYAFTPGQDDDGASIRIPRALLSALRRSQVEASVPAYLAKRVEARLRKLPKATRKRLQPLSGTAERLTERLIREQERGDLDARLHRLLLREFDIAPPPGAWDEVVEQPFWMPRVVVIDDRGKPIAADRDLARLQSGLKPEGGALPQQVADAPAAVVARDWQFGELPDERQRESETASVRVYPALRRVPGGVQVHEFMDAERARRSHSEAIVALLQCRFSQQMKAIRKALLGDRQIQLQWAAFDDPGGQRLLDDLQEAAIRHAFKADLQSIRSAASFRSLAASGAAELIGAANRIRETLGDILTALAACRAALAECPSHMAEARDDVESQMRALVYPGFLAATPADRLADLVRYLRAAELRLQRYASNPERDSASMAMVHSLEARVRGLRDLLSGERQALAVDAFRWQIQELRVSLFAQTLGTREKVSLKRLEKRWDEILRLHD